MAEEKKGFFKRLVSGLTKTRDNIVAGFDSLFTGYSTIDDDFYEELEEILIMGDIGINATTAILDKLKDQVEIRNIRDPKECKQLLIDTIKEQMTVDSTEYEFENRKSVILVIGVNHNEYLIFAPPCTLTKRFFSSSSWKSLLADDSEQPDFSQIS